MSSFLGAYKVEDWYDDFPMYAYVNPNDICPKETALLAESQSPASELTPYAESMDNVKIVGDLKYSDKFVKGNLRDISLVDSENLFLPNNFAATTSDKNRNSHTFTSISDFLNPCNSHHTRQLPLLKHLDIRKEKFNQRQKQLKEQFDNQPLPKVSPSYNTSGRKLSGRERQLDLERQEREQLQLRSNYLEQINQLEQKCEKLKTLLERIVEASPVYDDELIRYLNDNELFGEPIGCNRLAIGFTDQAS